MPLTGSRAQSCSYCVKTNKNCTYHWAQSRSRSETLDPRSARVNKPQTSRSRHARQAKSGRPPTTDQLVLGSPPFEDLLTTASPNNNDAGSWGPFVPDSDLSVFPSGAFDSPFTQTMAIYPGDPAAILPMEDADEMPEDSSHLPRTNNQTILHPTPHNVPSEYGFNSLSSSDRSLDLAKPTAIGLADSPQCNMESDSSDISSLFRARRPSYNTYYDSLPPSFFSTEQNLMDRTNGDLISGNLLRIYHDVLEYSLSCWLTEDTCPYKPHRWNSASPGLVPHPQKAPAGEPATNLTYGGRGPALSNRIYGRVVKLDQVARSAKVITLTNSEDNAASKALRLAIMAFATQWAQKSGRMEDPFNQTSTADDLGTGIADEFDRSLQRSFWEQARSALQDCADLETFKVVCAEVIFGWTQKPWEDDVPFETNDNATDAEAIRATLGTQIEEIISKDGLPVFLERAARKMRALKFKVDVSNRAGLDGANAGQTNRHGGRAAGVLDSEDRGTVGLLYWLTVMADTISSSMHERPVVLADQDCQHDDTVGAEPPGNGKLHAHRWWVDLFIQDNPMSPSQSTRWPCSPAAAAAAVQKSAPVKVLLYRHVSYLQNALRGRGMGQVVEDTIQSAMLIYRYWNMTYGAFFRDLIENYKAVLPEIRGWFVCIHAHWHLAALMLADLIEVVDENDLGAPGAKLARKSAATLDRIRRSSADELSDLSRVSTPAEHDGSSGEPQMPDFHFAVNTGTILTEPWTIILIRAYSKAYVLHFVRADELWRHDKAILGHKSRECCESLRRCKQCICALWFLGKKSDMARRVSKTLTSALKALEACMFNDMLQQASEEETLSGFEIIGSTLII